MARKKGAVPARRSASIVSDMDRRPGRKTKLAERVATEIEGQIAAMGWPVGRSLGTEASLAEKHGVSRAVVREAVRLLEHHMAVSSRRGTGGGVVVRRPDISAVVPVTGVYLDCEGVSPQTLLEARSAIELSAVALAAERITEEKRRRLHAALEIEHTALRDPHTYLLSHDLHILIAELSENPALRLFVAVLTQLTSEHSRRRFATVTRTDAMEAGRGISTAHAKIVDAIVDGDVGLAQKRMLSHLEAISPWLT